MNGTGTGMNGTGYNTGYGAGNNTGNNAANTSDIKKSVAQIVRASNTGIDTVYVSTERNFMNRLNTVGNGVRNGRPIGGFTNELRDMVRRINPINR
jgi:spore cortex protein